MDEDLMNSLLLIGSALEKCNVQYMLVGGTAVALHGYYRHSVDSTGALTDKPDIDIWYNPSYENYYNLLNALTALGQDVTEFKNEQSPDPRKSFFKLDFEAFTCDLLPEVKASIRFVEAGKRKLTVDLEGTQIHFMSYSDLLRDKEATARKKDLEDIEALRKARNKD